jgi:mono/diheme cytochrome c family protein
MKSVRDRLFVALTAIFLVENAWLLYPALRDVLLQVEVSEAARGRRLAQNLGCFSCHGPEGRGGVPNPGSEGEEVPSFHEGTPMMFVKSEQEIREYILDGAPAAKRSRASYREEMAAQAIRMPAFRGWVSDRDLEAMVTYVRAVSGLVSPAREDLARGEDLVHQNGCFACHGEMGSGGVPNPGSLKGYVPGFTGADFAELVRDDRELVEWIREGSIARLREHPIGSFFLKRQRIQMPAYKSFLSEEEIQAVAAYVRWLAEGEWQRQPLIQH